MTTSKPRKPSLDLIDRRILKRIELDARLPNRDLAEAVRLSPSGCLSRMRRLEESGIIQRYLADIDECVFVGWVVLWGELTLTATGRSQRQVLELRMQKTSAIVEVRHVVGRADYLVRVCSQNASDWSPLLHFLDPDGLFISEASVQVEASVIKRFSGLPQLD